MLVPLFVVPTHKQVIPDLFQCATYPLTCLIDYLWKKHEPSLKEGYVVNPFELETMAMLERTLNYAHTGSARVLTRTLMDRAWLSISVVKDGLPCISNTFIQPGSLASGMVSIRQDTWPVHPGTQMPLTSSQRSQELTYGKPHYAVRQSHSSRSHITDHGHNAGCVLLFVYRIMDMGVNVGCGTFVDRLSQSYLASFTINLAMKYSTLFL